MYLYLYTFENWYSKAQFLWVTYASLENGKKILFHAYRAKSRWNIFVFVSKSTIYPNSAYFKFIDPSVSPGSLEVYMSRSEW